MTTLHLALSLLIGGIAGSTITLLVVVLRTPRPRIQRRQWRAA